MAARTGSTYISGTMTDSVKISTMTSSRKCCQMITTTTNYGTVLQCCFQLRIAAVHVSMQSRQMRKRHFCSFVTVTNVPTKRKSVLLFYVSVWAYLIFRYLQCRQSYKYIRSGQPYCWSLSESSGALSLNSPRSKTRDLPLEFRRCLQ